LDRDYPDQVVLVVPLLALVLISGAVSDFDGLEDSSKPTSSIDGYANDLLFLGYAESVAKSLSAEPRSNEETARALVMWTHLNVRTQNTTPGVVINDGALNVVRRGYGYCDQSAQILASVAWALGWESRMWFLRDADGVSPHAVAEINWGDGWVLADPWLGLLGVEDDGDLVSVEDLSSEDAAYEVSGYARTRFAADYFANAEKIERLPYSLGADPAWAALGWISEVLYRGVGTVNRTYETAASALFPSSVTPDPTLRIVWPRTSVDQGRAAADPEPLSSLDPNRAAYVGAVSRLAGGDFAGASFEIDRALGENPNTDWRDSLVYLQFLLGGSSSSSGYDSSPANDQIPAEANIRIGNASKLTVELRSLAGS